MKKNKKFPCYTKEKPLVKVISHEEGPNRAFKRKFLALARRSQQQPNTKR